MVLVVVARTAVANSFSRPWEFLHHPQILKQAVEGGFRKYFQGVLLYDAGCVCISDT